MSAAVQENPLNHTVSRRLAEGDKCENESYCNEEFTNAHAFAVLAYLLFVA